MNLEYEVIVKKISPDPSFSKRGKSCFRPIPLRKRGIKGDFLRGCNGRG
jgi:hypothetical protein